MRFERKPMIVLRSTCSNRRSPHSRPSEAEELLLAGYALITRDRGDDSRLARDVLEDIVQLYERWGRPAQAAEYRAMTPESASGP